jgi:predicted acyl esterase
MRDGIHIYIDLYRPETELKYPVVIAWGPYGKQGHSRIYSMIGNTGLNDEILVSSPHLKRLTLFIDAGTAISLNAFWVFRTHTCENGLTIQKNP